MQKVKWIILIGLSVIFSCKSTTDSQITDEAIWSLGWRMIISTWDGNLEIADLQFDSLQKVANPMELTYLKTGLKVKMELNKEVEVLEILANQDAVVLKKLCTNEALKSLSPCNPFSDEGSGNEILKLELIQMYIDDQATRGNTMTDMIEKYGLDKNKVTQEGELIVDERNRTRLKEIFQEFGFPDRKLVGQDAMDGIFLIIQHSDEDTGWQKSQLKHIEKAAKNGDLDGANYAFLYDRIKTNEGAKQLYGTQFKQVVEEQNIYELAPTKDVINLDRRRKEIGLMPIEMYKKLHARYSDVTVR